MNIFPHNLESLHKQEEQLREVAKAHLMEHPELLLHLEIAENAMDLLDLFRQLDMNDDDTRTVRHLGLRMFNALGAAIKLSMTGYSQNAALIMRDVLETVFLVDLFSTDRSCIGHWREAETRKDKEEFRPVNVRKALDDRDGFKTRKRENMYRMFSELAAHPNPKGFAMLRPKGMDAQGGPFFDPTALQATLSELGRLSVQVGEIVIRFLPDTYTKVAPTQERFDHTKLVWIDAFYRTKPYEPQ